MNCCRWLRSMSVPMQMSISMEQTCYLPIEWGLFELLLEFFVDKVISMKNRLISFVVLSCALLGGLSLSPWRYWWFGWQNIDLENNTVRRNSMSAHWASQKYMPTCPVAGEKSFNYGWKINPPRPHKAITYPGGRDLSEPLRDARTHARNRWN